MYWSTLYVTGTMMKSLSPYELIDGVIDFRTKEFFETGKRPASLVAVYLPHFLFTQVE